MRPIATKFEHRLTAAAWVLAAVATCALADVPANQPGKPQSQEASKKPESAAGNPSTVAAEKVTKDGPDWRLQAGVDLLHQATSTAAWRRPSCCSSSTIWVCAAMLRSMTSRAWAT